MSNELENFEFPLGSLFCENVNSLFDFVFCVICISNEGTCSTWTLFLFNKYLFYDTLGKQKTYWSCSIRVWKQKSWNLLPTKLDVFCQKYIHAQNKRKVRTFWFILNLWHPHNSQSLEFLRSVNSLANFENSKFFATLKKFHSVFVLFPFMH